MKFAERARTWVRSYRQDRRGVTAITFALSAMVLLGATFAAVDASRIAGARTELQDALDAATLAAALKAPSSKQNGEKEGHGDNDNNNNSRANTAGRAFLAAQLSGNATLTNISSTFTPDEEVMKGVATADVDPVFMDLFTGSVVHLTANSEVKRGQGQTLELALVLDTTGSMAGTKIATLITASRSLATKLFQGGGDKVKIAVIPFANYVNVGVASRTQPWANVPADFTVHHNGGSYDYTPTCDPQTCDWQSYSCTGYNDGVAYQTTCWTPVNCRTTHLSPCPGTETVYYGGWDDVYTFRGCYGSPSYPQNVRDSDLGRQYPGFLNLDCSRQVTPLTSSTGTVVSAINALSAADETYIPAGLAWGFNALSSPAPLTEGAAYDTTGPNQNPHKVLILMTDGANTKLMYPVDGSHWPSPPNGARATLADTWTAELCTNIKAQNIEVYTVAFEIPAGDTISRDLVRNCATDVAHYFDAADSTALTAAFEAIGEALQALHISK